VIQTVEALIDVDGSVRLLESIHLSAARRALVTILDERPIARGVDRALSIDAAFKDWDRPEEDEAWAHLQPAR
jgi:hypothetical protein